MPRSKQHSSPSEAQTAAAMKRLEAANRRFAAPWRRAEKRLLESGQITRIATEFLKASDLSGPAHPFVLAHAAGIRLEVMRDNQMVVGARGRDTLCVDDSYPTWREELARTIASTLLEREGLYSSYSTRSALATLIACRDDNLERASLRAASASGLKATIRKKKVAAARLTREAAKAREAARLAEEKLLQRRLAHCVSRIANSAAEVAQ